ncbi:MAG: hypothetical protein OEW21_01735 [Betaproteobacteria bacterium]|nr:hypothetical protein [Betaproteobacteria bacterium]
MNPYAPPAAEVEHRGRIGDVFRKAKLVAMHTEGQLPPRCIVCNAAAPDYRIAHTLHWSPPAWRWGMAALVATLLGLAFAGIQVAALAFWPTMLIAMIANLIVRRKFTLDVAMCDRHRRRHVALTWTAALSIPAVAIAIVFLLRTDRSAMMLGLLPAMLALGYVRSRSGALAVRAAGLEGDRLWLKGTGKAFRDSLPEATDA